MKAAAGLLASRIPDRVTVVVEPARVLAGLATAADLAIAVLAGIAVWDDLRHSRRTRNVRSTRDQWHRWVGQCGRTPDRETSASDA